jgi:hypothetical protein
MNFRAILVAQLIGVVMWFCMRPFLTDFRQNHDLVNGAAFGIFFIAALLFHIKPELLGKLNKPKEKAAEEEDSSNEDQQWIGPP